MPYDCQRDADDFAGHEQIRVVGGTFDLRGGLVSKAFPRKIQMLREHKSNSFQLAVVTRSVKTPSCDNYQAEELWEAVGGEASDGMVLRH